MRLKFSVALLAVTLSGCGSLQNFTTEDIMTQEYERRSEVLDMTIPQIQQALYDYSAKCTQYPPLRINPSDSNKALFLTVMPGLTQANPAIIIQFTQSGQQTKVVSYSYYYSFGWPGQIDDIYEAIKDPKKCR